MVWLTQAQMAELFQKDRTVITRHINNVFKEGELEKEEVCANFAHTTRHGAIEGKQQTQEIVLYNLDVIISVGYRVKSKRGTASQSYDCKDKKIKSKKQVLRFKIWQGENKTVSLHSFFIDLRLTILGSQRRAFFMPLI
jgi:hypothetical protein